MPKYLCQNPNCLKRFVRAHQNPTPQFCSVECANATLEAPHVPRPSLAKRTAAAVAALTTAVDEAQAAQDRVNCTERPPVEEDPPDAA